MKEEFEMKLATENLKIKEVILEIKRLGGGDEDKNKTRQHVPLNQNYRDIMAKLGEQHRQFIKVLEQVKLIVRENFFYKSYLWSLKELNRN